MNYSEIRPHEVAAGDARTILDFLNGAESSAEIDLRIDLPGEPDIGPRLAAHIFDHRTQIGSFTSLEQLFDVPLIGPVRFAQIVRSLVPNVRAGISRDEFDALVAEVAALRGVGAAPGAVPRIELRAVDPPHYIGQPLTVVATAVAADGEPLDGVPVTLSASWGRLRGSDGLSVQEGASVTLRTSGDGTVTATLVAPTSEDLAQTQQAAVEFELRRLSPDAATPEDALDALTSLVAAYRFEANDDFRNGVDVYFRDFHAHLVDRVNYADELKRWRTFDSVVVAYLHERDDDAAKTVMTAVQSVAADVVRVRDWLAPWLQVHVTSMSAATLLGGDLALATTIDDADEALTNIHGKVRDFVSFQQGVAGRVVGEKVADAKLNHFLGTELATLPDTADMKWDLGSLVGDSSVTLGTLGVHALNALEQTRVEVRRRVTGDVGTLVDGAIASATAGLVDQETFDHAIAGKVDRAAFQTALATKVDQTTFTNALAAKVDLATLNDKLREAADFASFKTELTSVFQPLIPPGGFIVNP